MPPTPSDSFTADDLARATGFDIERIDELQRLGLIVAAKTAPKGAAVFDHNDLLVAEVVAAFEARGLPARSLRMFKVAADREAGVYEQVLASLIARRNADRLRSELTELLDLSDSLRRLLLKRVLRPHLD